MVLAICLLLLLQSSVGLEVCAASMKLAKLPLASRDVLVVGRPLIAGGNAPIVVFAHGLGDTGAGWSDIAAELPGYTWVLPTVCS